MMQLEMQALRRSGSSALDLRERAAQMQRDLKSLASQEFDRTHLSAHLTKAADLIQKRATLVGYLKVPLGVGDAVLDYGNAVVSALGFVADGGRIVGGCMRVFPPDPEAAKRMEQRSQSVGSFFRAVGDLAVLAESSPGTLYDAALQRTEERGKRMANSSRAIVQAIGDLPAPEQGRLATRIATHGLLLRYPFPLELGPLTAREPSLVLARAATRARPPAAARTSTEVFLRVIDVKIPIKFTSPKRGEVYMIHFDAPRGPHPGLVLSESALNASTETVIVAPITSNVSRVYKSSVVTSVKNRPGKITLDEIGTVKKSRLIQKMEELDADTMLRVEETIKYILDLK